jgi:hypothetical protein
LFEILKEFFFLADGELIGNDSPFVRGERATGERRKIVF